MPGLRGFELAEDNLPDCRSTAGERAHNVGRFHAIQQTYLQSSQNDLSARAPQAAMPSVGFVSGRSAEVAAHLGGAFHKGLNETGYAEGQNVVVEYHWLEADTIKVILLYPSRPCWRWCAGGSRSSSMSNRAPMTAKPRTMKPSMYASTYA